METTQQMQLHGQNFIGAGTSAEGSETLRARNAATGETVEPAFHAATPAETDQALQAARKAFEANRAQPPEARARLLEGIADEIEALGETLVERAVQETALGAGRLEGERARTTGQLRMFAEVVREGSWVDARIDRGQPPESEGGAAPDVRRMNVPIGPVAVFGASNFPLAFSVAGGDTASALAAGCSVIVKAHPAHPGTSELVGRAIRAAVDASELHPGTFSMLHGAAPAVSLELVRHPLTKAVGFTGSLTAGRAIFDAAAARTAPIPVYAEMGSVNPVFVLPGALSERGGTLAEELTQSLTLGAGQFCTNPGLVFGLKSEALEAFVETAAQHVEKAPAFDMLHEGIREGYEAGLRAFGEVDGVRRRAYAVGNGRAASALFTTDVETYRKNERLGEEVFGPSTLVVQSEAREELVSVARALKGNLTATIHGTQADLEEYSDLVRVLEDKVGRLIFNVFPTGVRVCPAMHHGGPYPATTDVRSTSVGTAAIERFARPICYQDFPQAALPPELRDENERGLWRLVDGEQTREDL